MAVFVMFAFVVIGLFMASQNLFSQFLAGETPRGGTLEYFIPHLSRVLGASSLLMFFWAEQHPLYF